MPYTVKELDSKSASSTKKITYPSSDGKPMAENTEHFKWITTIEGGLETLFAENDKVFVAGDLLWYPVEKRPDIRAAPDAMVVFGRPKGTRLSYLQWQEDDIAPQVVFEIVSPNNSKKEMANKLHFYEQYGVEEYYLYTPKMQFGKQKQAEKLSIYYRKRDYFALVDDINSWRSPRLGVGFRLTKQGLEITRSDGSIFKSYVALSEQLAQEQNRLLEVSKQVEAERERAKTEHERAETERKRAETERKRAESEHKRAEYLSAKLKELGFNPEKL